MGIDMDTTISATSRRDLIRTALAPRRPPLRLFTQVLAPMAGALSLAFTVALVAAGGAPSGVTFAWYIALPLVGAAAGILVVTAWVRLAPTHLFDSRSLGVALAASYLPHMVAAVAAVSVALALMTTLPDRLQPLSQASIDGMTSSTATLLAVLAWAVGIWGLAAWLANRISALREREATYRAESSARLEDLEESRQRIVGAQESLRKATAEALHGPVQNRLLLASHRLSQAAGAVQGDAAPAVQEARALIDGVISMDLRSLIQQLHPSAIRLSTETALRSLAERYAGEFEVGIEVDPSLAEVERAGAGGLPEPVRLTVYRVVEDALNNVLKHAVATSASVWLGMPTPEGLLLTVEDNGRGFDVEGAPLGMGILSMRDYCGAQGGALAIESEVNRGTRVTAFIPVGAGEASSQRLSRPPSAAPALAVRP